MPPATATMSAAEGPVLPPIPPDATTRLTRALALGLWAGLVGLGLAWELWLAPTGHGTLSLKVLPLLPALPGLWRWRLYTYRWLALLVWLYAFEGLVRVGSDHGRSAVLAGVEVLLAVGLFAACAAHIRWRLKRARA